MTIRNKDKSYTKDAASLDEEANIFVREMHKKYKKKLTPDEIGYVIQQSVFTETTFAVVFGR